MLPAPPLISGSSGAVSWHHRVRRPRKGKRVPDTVPVVLVVDIDPETHLATDGALPEAECVLVGARSAEMALKLAERRPPSVLVVDGKIGGLSYLAERLRRVTPHLHV